MTALGDKQMRKRVWHGAIPVMFTVAQNDVAALSEPGAYFALIPRGSYITLYSKQLRAYFGAATSALQDELWFETNNIALKWHYPLGVLFDLYGDPAQLPWRVTVHFQGFPSSELLRCPSEDVIQAHYTNVLKEANYLKHGDGSKMNSLSLEDSTNLWDGLLKGDYEKFWSANDKLTCSVDDLKSVPCRICRGGASALQELVLPVHADGRARTLEDVLNDVFNADELAEARVLVQGVAPPLTASMAWLHQHMAAYDGFLYIVIK